MNIVGKRNWYFAFSLLIIIPGLISLFLWGLNLSIDFTGGSEMTFIYPQKVTSQTVSNVKASFIKEKIQVISVQPSGDQIAVRTKSMSDIQDSKIIADLQKNKSGVKQDQ